MHAVESGKDLGARTMIAFGGNGPLHATRVARRAGVARILVPPDPGVGSAVGFLSAPVAFEVVRSRYATLDDLDAAAIERLFADMLNEAEAVVRAGAPGTGLERRRSAYMRYRGQGHEIEIALDDRPMVPDDVATLRSAFEAEYRRQFARVVPGMVIEILNWAVRVQSAETPAAPLAKESAGEGRVPAPRKTVPIVCDVTGQSAQADLFMRAELAPGTCVSGPSLIVDPQTTTFVSRDFDALVAGDLSLVLTRKTRREAIE